MEENKVIEILKEVSSKLKNAKKNDYENADWGGVYKKAKEHYEEIEVHACGDFPQKLIGSNFPNESDVEKQYRRNSFQPTTKPYWKKAVKRLNRIWAEQNFSIDFKDETAKEYFTEKTPLYVNTFSFFKSIATQSKINDPNGVLVVDFDLPVKQTSEGDFVIDDSKEIAPYPSIYECDDVLMFEEGDFTLLMSEEKSIVEFGNGKVNDGYVMYLYTTTEIWRIVQVGKKVDWKFEAKVYYTHGLGYLPAWKLKGTPEEVINGAIYYESYFAGALPHLNEAVIIHSTNKSVRNKVSFPTRVYYEQKCNADGCNNGKVFNESENSWGNCSKCNGTGSVRFSPFTDYIHETPNLTNDAANVSFPGFTYVSPDGGIIKDNEDVIDKYMSIAFSFINFEGTPDGNKAGLGEGATATKTKIDREEQFISILDISNDLFELLGWYLDAAYQIRYNKESEIEINPPKNFELVSSEEMTAEISEAKSNGIPSVVLSEMMVDYVKKKFPLNANVSRIAEIAQYSDSLFTLDDSTIQMIQTGGNVAKWEVILHYNFQQFMYQVMTEKENWAEMDLKEVHELLKAKAIEKEKELNANRQTADRIINEMGGGSDIGKVPLAIQQLALARMRADEAGDSTLSNQLGNKIDELLKNI